jgi:hypothetical protein
MGDLGAKSHIFEVLDCVCQGIGNLFVIREIPMYSRFDGIWGINEQQYEGTCFKVVLFVILGPFPIKAFQIIRFCVEIIFLYVFVAKDKISINKVFVVRFYNGEEVIYCGANGLVYHELFHHAKQMIAKGQIVYFFNYGEKCCLCYFTGVNIKKSVYLIKYFVV